MMKSGKKYFSKSNIIVIWMSSFAVLLLFCFLMMTLGYISVEKRLNRQIEQMNEAFNTERVKHVDNYISNIMNGIINISKLEGFEDMLRLEGKTESERRYAVSKFSRSVSVLEIGDLEPSVCFVYIPEVDYVVGNGIVRSSYDYFKTNRFKGSYEQWKNDVLSENEQGMLYYDAENEQLYFKAWQSGKASRRVMISIVIPKSEFVEKFRVNDGMDFVISGTDNRQILSVTDRDYGELIKSIEFTPWISTEFVDRYIVSYQKSIGTDWSYLCVFDTGIYTNAFKATRVVIVCFGAAVMVFGILMGYYFTRKNNKFIFRLVDVLNVSRCRNEYEALYATVNEIIADANKNSKLLYSQSKNIRNELLGKLLSERILPADTDSQLEQIGLAFEYEYFCVAEIGIAGYFNIFFEENPNTAEALSLSKYIIDNVYGDLGNDEVKIYPAATDGAKIVLVINCAYENEEDKANIKQILNFGAAFIEENFNISLTITLSELEKGKESINKCYDSVLWAKNYIVRDYNGILDCGENKARTVLAYYSYSQNDEQLLIADIKRGDYDKLTEDIDKLFRLNTERKTAPKYMKLLAINIFDLIVRTVNAEASDANGFFETVNETYELIEKFEDLQAVEKSLGVLAEAACGFINTDERQYKRSATDEIKKYIDRNYANPALNVNYISNWFNLKPSFLSKLFKEQEKCGALEYINMKRIDAAMELLKTTDYSMTEIWERIGFTSERTFFRTFEKYVGTSPGKFKRNLSQEYTPLVPHPDET